MSEKYKKTSTVVSLDAKSNQLLTEAAKRSGRSKVQEASIRLRDHLLNFSEIASEGKRFEVEASDSMGGEGEVIARFRER